MCIQLAKRTASQKETKFTGQYARAAKAEYTREPFTSVAVIPPYAWVWPIPLLYRLCVSVRATALRNAVYCRLVISVRTMLYE